MAIDKEFDLGSPPYFYAPYPKELLQVHVPETEGGKQVAEMIRDHWPEKISELEKISRDYAENGYTGSFIRSVLRSNFAPADPMTESKEISEHRELEAEADLGGIQNPTEEIDEDWHRVFRLGVRAALQNGIPEEEAFEAFGSGFVEGKKLKEEMGDELQFSELVGK